MENGTENERLGYLAVYRLYRNYGFHGGLPKLCFLLGPQYARAHIEGTPEDYYCRNRTFPESLKEIRDGHLWMRWG